jgi:hypothetical protein
VPCCSHTPKPPTPDQQAASHSDKKTCTTSPVHLHTTHSTAPQHTTSTSPQCPLLRHLTVAKLPPLPPQKGDASSTLPMQLLPKGFSAQAPLHLMPSVMGAHRHVDGGTSSLCRPSTLTSWSCTAGSPSAPRAFVAEDWELSVSNVLSGGACSPATSCLALERTARRLGNCVAGAFRGLVGMRLGLLGSAVTPGGAAVTGAAAGAPALLGVSGMKAGSCAGVMAGCITGVVGVVLPAAAGCSALARDLQHSWEGWVTLTNC